MWQGFGLLVIGRAVLPALLAAGLATAAAAASEAPRAAVPDLSPPWPQEAALGDLAGQTVTFPSHSPFALADVGNPSRDPRTEARATLFLPPQASPAAPVPALVLLHGSSGVLEERELTYARQLAALGVAALVVDTFGARRDRATSFIDRLLKITESMMLADAYAALRYLDKRPEIDGNRVALIGFSYGGMVSIYAAYAQVAESYAPGGERFAAHVAYYGPCIAEFEDSRATGAPLLMLHGGKDEIVDAKRCAEVAAALESGGSQVKTIVYPEAFHQWDGRFGNPRRIGRNLSPCRFQVARDGTVTAPFWPFAMSDSFNRRMMLGMCSESEGYMIGRDDKVRERSNADLARFLETVFASENAARAQSAARVPPKRN